MATKKKDVIVSDVTVSKKKKTSVKKTVVKKAPKKTKTKKLKTVSVVSQSPISKKRIKIPEHVLTTTATRKVDTSTPVNKWIAADPVIHADDLSLIPIPEHSYAPRQETKLFEMQNVEQAAVHIPFWIRILWWFVKK